MKKAFITGAGGFIGNHLVELLLSSTNWHLTLFDTYLANSRYKKNSRITLITADLCQSDVLAQALIKPYDYVFHMAALPGGSAEQNPQLSRKINLDASLYLFDLLAQHGHCPRLVYSSTIAVLGAPMPEQVDDLSPIVPAMIYGTHKAMIELALADYHRRGKLDVVSIRLPGILARPMSSNGLKSAFLSHAFHLLSAGKHFTSPVSPQATMWLMSVQQCAHNLLRAAQLDSHLMPVNRVVTLPALRVLMLDFLHEIVSQTQQHQSLLSWQPDAQLEALFGQQPPLTTTAADKAGFKHDGALQTLVARALSICT
ncbi:NAD-dependent epimerase/dehydratase family protein [Flavobacterium sp. W21_SRS_FM6]|uniref:NAD-dependent epimerase/dehydratase family protein n=1 Tax=Flavobacterium sp. W21_SRS_FM6 TaxID=3240268 RepID=UPI003F8E65DF